MDKKTLFSLHDGNYRGRVRVGVRVRLESGWASLTPVPGDNDWKSVDVLRELPIEIFNQIFALWETKTVSPVNSLWLRHEGVVSKETVVLRRWGSSIQKFGFINGVDNVNWPPYRDSKS